MVSQIRFLYEAGAKTKDPKAVSASLFVMCLFYNKACFFNFFLKNRKGLRKKEMNSMWMDVSPKIGRHSVTSTECTLLRQSLP